MAYTCITYRKYMLPLKYTGLDNGSTPVFKPT